MDSFSPNSAALFKGRHFDRAIIILCVRWYITYKLSLRDLCAMMAERHVEVAHTTIVRWVQRYVPDFAKRWQRYARPTGPSWRADETYIKVKGHWVYLYRAVDSTGQTIDFLLSECRDVTAAKRFFEQAIEKRGVPEKITLDGYAASHKAVAELQAEDTLPSDLTVRTNRYLNNVIEQDHRRVKQRVRPMLGFKQFAHAAVTIAGIELAHQIKKRQFDLSALCSPGARAPQVGEAVFAA
jgi:transposase-like protein